MPVQQMFDGGDMPCLLHRHRQRARRGPRLAGRAACRRLGAEQEQPGTQDVPHHKAGRRRREREGRGEIVDEAGYTVALAMRRASPRWSPPA